MPATIHHDNIGGKCCFAGSDNLRINPDFERARLEQFKTVDTDRQKQIRIRFSARGDNGLQTSVEQRGMQSVPLRLQHRLF